MVNRKLRSGKDSVNLYSAPIESWEEYRAILGGQRDCLLLLEARRRLWAALHATSRSHVARLLGRAPSRVAELLQLDVAPTIEGVLPLSTWRGRDGNPALQVPLEERAPVYRRGRPRAAGEK